MRPRSGAVDSPARAQFRSCARAVGVRGAASPAGGHQESSVPPMRALKGGDTTNHGLCTPPKFPALLPVRILSQQAMDAGAGPEAKTEVLNTYFKGQTTNSGDGGVHAVPARELHVVRTGSERSSPAPGTPDVQGPRGDGKGR